MRARLLFSCHGLGPFGSERSEEPLVGGGMIHSRRAGGLRARSRQPVDCPASRPDPDARGGALGDFTYSNGSGFRASGLSLQALPFPCSPPPHPPGIERTLGGLQILVVSLAPGRAGLGTPVEVGGTHPPRDRRLSFVSTASRTASASNACRTSALSASLRSASSLRPHITSQMEAAAGCRRFRRSARSRRCTRSRRLQP